MRQNVTKSKLALLASLVLVGSSLVGLRPIDVKGATPTYPFRTGAEAFVNGVKWTGPAAATGDQWQYLDITLDQSYDLTEAAYLLIQYKADLGTPGMTVGLVVNGDRYGTAGPVSGEVKPSFFNEDGTITSLQKIEYGALWVPEGKVGTLGLPLTNLGWQWNNNSSTLSSVNKVYFTTNSMHNYNWAFTIGEIGFFKADYSYTKMLDLTEGAKPSKYYFDSNILTTLTPISGYPLPVGDKAFNGGRTWAAPTTGASSPGAWQTLFVNFATPVNLTTADYLAVQYRADSGAPGLTWAVENSGTRFSAQVDNDPLYFQNEGSLARSEVSRVLYGSFNVTEGKVGIALLPISELHFQFGDNSKTLGAVNNFLLTTDFHYNYNFKISIGKVGYIKNDVFTELTIDSYFATSGNLVVVDVQDWKIADSTTYPFRVGEDDFKNARGWLAPASGNTVDDFQIFKVNFDTVTNLEDASYLAIQVNNVLGGPGLTYSLETAIGEYSIAGVADGEKVYVINENGSIETAALVQFAAITATISGGVLLIPMEAFGPIGGAVSLEAVSALKVTTNRRYNYNFNITFGEIGFYKGEIGEATEVFTKVFDLSVDKSAAWSKSGSVTNEFEIVNPRPERSIYGDSIITLTGTNKTSANFGIWTGGSYGSVTMVEDTYGDTAMQLMATGTNPEGDAYTAITIGGGYDNWDGLKGVTFWARNDSDKEISFNIELDCKINGITDRFNIKQGNRFYLYDVNTKTTSIYMTKPTATLPVGFEGWVRIPFTAFFRADWSNNGVTKELFMAEGAAVTYLAITIHSPSYKNLPFSLNKFGAYATNPLFVSPFVPVSENRPDIATLMELNG